MVAAAQVAAALHLPGRPPALDRVYRTPPHSMASAGVAHPCSSTPGSTAAWLSPGLATLSVAQGALPCPPPPRSLAALSVGPPPGDLSPLGSSASAPPPPPAAPIEADKVSVARRRRTGRGGDDIGGVRSQPDPKPTVMKINIFKVDCLGLEPTDRRRMRPWVAFAIDKVLGCTSPFCSPQRDKLCEERHWAPAPSLTAEERFRWPTNA